ncbi:pca operon transcription factor PcaQ [Cohaesibacter celericrescens]|uniref:Pca operon transcription factor PcaQ n=1 Tax=Cohaesibacter celericrescens TaxID=2067669 RepID=A0A2N5XU18_9HYPH|nr:pca operon transcription factor PcaQ [Cohaesibacter celericrescens]PLW77970.1 pca operon transcription factor PcaQ [Cohaesibacter celericrescens]
MIDRRIKFRHIQCFVEICRQKSLKKAAEKQFLTQPAISKTLKELEEILNTQLLIRSRAGVTPTTEGEVFLHFAEMSVASLQQGLYGVEQVSSGGKTRLAVGALPSVAASLMPATVEKLDAITQDVRLTISDGPHGYLINQLRQGELDLVIGRLGAPDTMQGISFTQLYNEHVVFVARPQHPMTVDPDLTQLTNWPVLFPSAASAIRPLVERFLIANGVGDIPNRIETVSGAFGRAYVAKTDAIWIISAGVVANEIEDGRLVQLPFEMDGTKGPVGLMVRQDNEPSPAERMFRLAITQAIKDLKMA